VLLKIDAEWERGFPGTRETPEEPAGWQIARIWVDERDKWVDAPTWLEDHFRTNDTLDEYLED